MTEREKKQYNQRVKITLELKLTLPCTILKKRFKGSLKLLIKIKQYHQLKQIKARFLDSSHAKHMTSFDLIYSFSLREKSQTILKVYGDCHMRALEAIETHVMVTVRRLFCYTVIHFVCFQGRKRPFVNQSVLFMSLTHYCTGGFRPCGAL